jgi:hypothetical protein
MRTALDWLRLFRARHVFNRATTGCGGLVAIKRYTMGIQNHTGNSLMEYGGIGVLSMLFSICTYVYRSGE